jgi:hypothetical protein
MGYASIFFWSSNGKLLGGYRANGKILRYLRLLGVKKSDCIIPPNANREAETD